MTDENKQTAFSIEQAVERAEEFARVLIENFMKVFDAFDKGMQMLSRYLRKQKRRQRYYRRYHRRGERMRRNS